MRLFPVLGFAGVGAALLVACGANTGGSGTIPLATPAPEARASASPGTGLGVGAVPTPVVLPSPTNVPTSVPASPVGGLPSPAPT